MLDRREFLKSMGIVGAGIAVAPTMAMGEVIKGPVKVDPKMTVSWDAKDALWTTTSCGESATIALFTSNHEPGSIYTRVSI